MTPTLTARLRAVLTPEVDDAASVACEDARDAFHHAQHGAVYDDARSAALRAAGHAAWQSVLLAAIAPVVEPTWEPMETAPKGGGAEDTRDPAWVQPPDILVTCEDGQCRVVYWDWYYAKGGDGFGNGSPWVVVNGENCDSAPTHWQPLPLPPATEPRA